MASRWTSLTLALAVVWVPGAARAEEAKEEAREAKTAPKAPDGVLPGQDLEHPPRGTPEDQALWRSGFEVTQAVHLERARATRLQTILLNLRYNDRLKTLEGRGGDAAKRAAALQRGLSDAHAVQFSVLTARWPVDTYRVCSYPAMEFGSMSAGTPTPDEVAKHRAMLTGCVEQAQASVKLLKQGNDGLEGAMKAAEDALSQAGLGPPSGPVAAPAKAAAAAQPVPATGKPGKDEEAWAPPDRHGR